MAKTHKKITLSNAKLQTLGRVLSAAISPGSSEDMDSDNKSKALYRLGKTHGNVARALEPLDEQIKRIGEEFTETDKDGNKVPNVDRVKNEETGEWEDKENGFKISDPDAYAKELRALSDEEVEVEVSIIPLSWLDGNLNVGGLASVCPDMVDEDG